MSRDDPNAPKMMRWFPKVDQVWDNMVVLVPSEANPEVGIIGAIVFALGDKSYVWTVDGRGGWYDIDDMRDPTQAAA